MKLNDLVIDRHGDYGIVERIGTITGNITVRQKSCVSCTYDSSTQLFVLDPDAETRLDPVTQKQIQEVRNALPVCN